MKDEFAEFFPPGDEEAATVWNAAHFVFDTNVLLRLYRYKTRTANELLDILGRLRERIWLPYQVGFEYNKNRFDKIHEAEQPLQHIMKQFTSSCDSVEKTLAEMHEFGLHPDEGIETDVKSIITMVRTKMSALSRKSESRAAAKRYNDIHMRLADLYAGKVGERPKDDELVGWFKEAEERYKKKIGPGYADADEKRRRQAPEIEIYGDYVVWKQMIGRSQDISCPIIFITEDTKEDWWLRRHGKTISLRPDLVREFIDATGHIVVGYRIQQFLIYAKKHLSLEISKETSAEVEAFAKRDAKMEVVAAKNERAWGALDQIFALPQPKVSRWSRVFSVDPKDLNEDTINAEMDLFRRFLENELAHERLSVEIKVLQDLLSQDRAEHAEVRAQLGNLTGADLDAKLARLAEVEARIIERHAKIERMQTEYIKAAEQAVVARRLLRGRGGKPPEINE